MTGSYEGGIVMALAAARETTWGLHGGNWFGDRCRGCIYDKRGSLGHSDLHVGSMKTLCGHYKLDGVHFCFIAGFEYSFGKRHEFVSSSKAALHQHQYAYSPRGP